jgi:hypothetical protein
MGVRMRAAMGAEMREAMEAMERRKLCLVICVVLIEAANGAGAPTFGLLNE